MAKPLVVAPIESLDIKAALLEAVVQLSPWTNHKYSCARVTLNDACDCGLAAALRKYFLL